MTKPFTFQRLLFPLILLLVITSCKKDSSVTEPEINKAPLLVSETFLTTYADSAFVHQLETEDPEGEEVEVMVLSGPDWLNFAENTKTLSGTPTRADAGVNEIEIQLSDGVNVVERELKVSVVILRSFQEILLENLQLAYDQLTPGLAGVSVAVSEPDGTITTAWLGSSHFSATKPITDSSRYRVASISKTFTAALIMRMVEEGHLELDVPFSNYLTIEGLEYGDQITIRQLLSHTGGVFDHLNSDDFWNDPNNFPGKVWSNEEIFQFAVDAGGYFPPGTDYAYSNTGFYILGAIAEEILQQPLRVIFDDWIMNPLGLDQSFYDNFSLFNNPIPNLAESEIAYSYSPSAAGAAGAIVSTPTDIAKFGKALYGGDFLQPENVDQMLENLGGMVSGSNYGLGTRIWNDQGIYHYGHTGSLMGYRSIFNVCSRQKCLYCHPHQ